MLPEQAAIMSATGSPRFSAFFYMATSGEPVRAWLGPGDYAVEADGVDETGGTYLGIGMVGDVPALRQLVGGLAERVDFTLNGADPVAFALADDEAATVRGAKVHVGVVFFDQDWQEVAPVAWLWEGTADMPAVDYDGAGGNPVRRISLSVGSAYTDRTRPSLGFYTDKDQKRRSATDDFCWRVAAYGVDSTIQVPGP